MTILADSALTADSATTADGAPIVGTPITLMTSPTLIIVTAPGVTLLQLSLGEYAMPVPEDNAWDSIEVEYSPKVRAAKFGDGAEQRARAGFNSNLQVWSLGYERKGPAFINELDAFLRARDGVESFMWTPPGEVVARRFVNPSHRRRLDNHLAVQSLSFTLREVPL